VQAPAEGRRIEMPTDKQRLNWLSKNGIRTIKNVAPKRGNSSCRGWSYSGRHFAINADVNESLRQAIDAAMRAERGGE